MVVKFYEEIEIEGKKELHNPCGSFHTWFEKDYKTKRNFLKYSWVAKVFFADKNNVKMVVYNNLNEDRKIWTIIKEG